MDWTGGTRRRFAGTKNNDTALSRQKAHFARARAAVRHEPDAGRPKTSVIAHNDDTRARSYKERSRLSPGFKGTSTNQQKSRNARLIGNEQQHNEELRLLASRRKLLSRSDWLALDSTRPLRINFTAGGDKDRVGRRKKVKRPSVGNGIAREPRRLTPLFEEGPRQGEPGCFMSGALPPANDEQIKIRVGTSALDSHSQLLKESEPLRAVSTGPPSTAPSRLSEECMLLGADGDSFDADQIEVPAYMQNEASSSGSSSPSLSLNFGGGPSTCETVPDNLTPGLNHEPLATHMQDEFDITRPSIEYQSDMQQVTRGRSAGHCFAPETRAFPYDEQETADLLLSLDQTPTACHGMTVSVYQNASEVDTEYMWKQLIGISANSDTLTSCKDMDEWIERIAASDTTQGAVIGDLHSDIGVDDATGVQPTAQTSTKTTTDTVKHCDGPNAPLMVTLHDLQNVSAHSPICPHNDPQANKDDEALWREFIIGSQDSRREDELHLACQQSRDKARYSTEPRSLELSGLGTSDKATRGGVSIVSSAIDPSQEMSSDGHIEPDEDGIEDPPVESSSPVNNPRNIHTTSTKWLDPKRFKKLGETDNVVTRRRTQSKVAARRQIRHAGKNSRKLN